MYDDPVLLETVSREWSCKNLYNVHPENSRIEPIQKRYDSGMKLTVLIKVKALTARPSDSSVKEVNIPFILTTDGQHFRIQEGDKLALTLSQEGKSSLGKLKLQSQSTCSKKIREMLYSNTGFSHSLKAAAT